MGEDSRAMMVEWRKILRKADTAAGGVLVTLVGVQGSSYRQVGARLFLAADGEAVGSISGGCLEGELVRRARWLVEQGAMVQHYSTAIDEQGEIPFGLGCGGELYLLLERADSVEVQQLFAEVRQVLGGARRRVATWLPESGLPLRRVIYDGAAATGGEVLFASAGTTADEIDAGRWPAEQHSAGETDPPTIFLEEMEPPQRLVVCGAGEDARPLVSLGALLGWTVVVMDGRRNLARPERFPEAAQVVVLDGETPPITAEDAVVILTHSYEQDRALLEAALPVAPRYLGLLGARHRSSLLVSEVAQRLGWPVARVCERLFAPVGLDLGGDGAEAIALAVVAEVQACLQGRIGLSRRLRPEDVAEQVSRRGGKEYLQLRCELSAS